MRRQLDVNKLEGVFKKLMEDHRQKCAFKTYLLIVTGIISGGGLFPFTQANVFAATNSWVIDMKLLSDNSISPWVQVFALFVATIGYFSLLYFGNRKYKYDILSSAAGLINEQFRFVPTQEWFRAKSELNIKNLGKSINLNVNFRYELYDDAFASTCRDTRVARLFIQEKSQLLSNYRKTREKFETKLDGRILSEIDKALYAITDNLALGDWNNEVLNTIDQSVEVILTKLHDAIDNKQIDYDDYDYTSIHSSLGKIKNHIHNEWIRSIKGQSLIVYGRGGIGKTHLLAKLVQSRLEENLPTLFVLGKLITDTCNPIDQILGELDLQCKKETFLQALNKYGDENGRVLVVVDGINEGAGLSLWKNHLLAFLNEFEQYKNIGIIISVRTAGGNNWFYKFIRDEGFPSYQHQGFSGNVTGAVEYMFKSFSVPLPTWPILNKEFHNPMLLTLFCRSHQGEEVSPHRESGLEIIEHYIQHFNQRLADFFQFPSAVNVLHDVLSDVAGQMISIGNRWRLPQTDLISILKKNQHIDDKADMFLNALLDEGVLNEYDLSSDNIFYTFGYDTIGSYMIAASMVEKGEIGGDILNDGSVLEALTDVLPQREGKELFEKLGDVFNEYPIKELFIENLSMRNTLTEAGKKMLQGLRDNENWERVFDVTARVPYQDDWPINANVLEAILKPMSLVKRDALWTTAISGDTVIKENISLYVSWGKSASQDVINGLNEKSLLLIIRLLIWTLATTDLALRDNATRALVNVLRFKKGLMLQCIRDYDETNDDYIAERLYAVVFGCCTGNQSKEYVGDVAQLTYDCMFKNGNPRENILVRDYGKNIVEYALYIGCTLDVNLEKVRGPYNKDVKEIFVPTEEILKYVLEYDKVADHELYWAQNNILESMRTEYSSRGMYGDFGRYTFQAALNMWEDDIEQLSNYAIKYIFEEIGYDAQMFKDFDGHYSSMSRHKNTIERIGKKYQWIAMYKVAALLADYHYGNEPKRDWYSPLNVSVRKFDTTLFMNPDVRDFSDALPAYHVPEYNLLTDDDETWMRSWKKMPRVENYIEYERDGRKWIDLYSYYTISSNTQSDVAHLSTKSERELWTFCHAFFVDERDRKKMCQIIDKEGLKGRSSSENREIYSIYYREYYWSENYKKEVVAREYTERPFEVGRRNTDIVVQPAYLLYAIGEYADASLTEGKEIKMPSPQLYESLGLKYSVSDGVWLMPDGTVGCYDSGWVHGGQGCLMIRKDLLLDFMRKHKKNIVWPILIERTYKPSTTFWPRIQVGGFVCMDGMGKLYSKFRSYQETKFDKIKRNIEAKMTKRWNYI